MLVIPAMTLPPFQASFLEGIQPMLPVMQAAGGLVFLLGAVLYLWVRRQERGRQ